MTYTLLSMNHLSEHRYELVADDGLTLEAAADRIGITPRQAATAIAEFGYAGRAAFLMVPDAVAAEMLASTLADGRIKAVA